MSEQEAGPAITGANPTSAVRAATRDGTDQLAATGAALAGGGLVARVRGIGSSVVDGFVVVVFLIFAGRARREALHTDADRIAEQWRTQWGPSAAKSLAACQPDPAVQDRILQQILATPRPAPSRLASARRWGRPVAALAGLGAALTQIAALPDTTGAPDGTPEPGASPTGQETAASLGEPAAPSDPASAPAGANTASVKEPLR